MGMLRRPGDAVGVGSWIAVASLAACGGSVADRVAHDEAPVDASVVSIDDAEPKGNTAPPDALAPCSTTCSDGAAGPRDAAGAQDVAEASAVSSVPALVPSYNELCEVVWPQPDGVMAGEMNLAVDSAGNAYLAFGYGGSQVTGPPIDLGDASASYAAGLAIVKVDAECHLLWLRQFGAQESFGSTFIDLTNIAVDGDSNVTLLGSLDASSIYASVFIRLDASGNQVFEKVLRALTAPGGLVVSPDGISTILASVPGSGGDVGAGIDAGAPDADFFGNPAPRLFARFDATGSALFQRTSSNVPPTTNSIASGPDGTLWGEGDDLVDGGSTPVLRHLTPTGDAIWSRPVQSDYTYFAVGPGSEMVFSNTGIQTIFGYSPDGASTASRSTTVPYAVRDATKMAVDANGNAVVGMTFGGTIEILEGGAFTTTGTPSGAGFEVFDATGTLRSLSTWGGPQGNFGAIGVDPSGNVVLAGYTVKGSTTGNATRLFLVRMAP